MEIKRIDVHETAAMLEQSEQTGLQIVDIRDEQSYRAGHIKAAQHLDNTSVQTFIENADPEKPLIIYCYHGNMSQSAAAYFSEQGFDDAYSMDGGYSDWELNFPAATEAS